VWWLSWLWEAMNLKGWSFWLITRSNGVLYRLTCRKNKLKNERGGAKKWLISDGMTLWYFLKYCYLSTMYCFLLHLFNCDFIFVYCFYTFHQVKFLVCAMYLENTYLWNAHISQILFSTQSTKNTFESYCNKSLNRSCEAQSASNILIRQPSTSDAKIVHYSK